MHDPSITAISNNYRRSVTTQTITCAQRRRVVLTGQCRPGNRNDAVIARAPVAHLLTSQHEILDDSGSRGITTITSPRRHHTGRIVRDDHHRAHRHIQARVEHVIARLKDRQILRQCRRRGDTIDHNLQTVADLWNLTTTSQIQVNS